MCQFKLKWSFINAEDGIKAIDLFGAKSLDNIIYYKNNKKIDKTKFHCLSSSLADKQAKEDITKFFKENCGNNDFIELIRN
jgi:hypothetical protein